MSVERKFMKNQKGFTIIEVVIAAALLGIVALGALSISTTVTKYISQSKAKMTVTQTSWETFQQAFQDWLALYYSVLMTTRSAKEVGYGTPEGINRLKLLSCIKPSLTDNSTDGTDLDTLRADVGVSNLPVCNENSADNGFYSNVYIARPGPIAGTLTDADSAVNRSILLAGYDYVSNAIYPIQMDRNGVVTSASTTLVPGQVVSKVRWKPLFDDPMNPTTYAPRGEFEITVFRVGDNLEELDKITKTAIVNFAALAGSVSNLTTDSSSSSSSGDGDGGSGEFKFVNMRRIDVQKNGYNWTSFYDNISQEVVSGDSTNLYYKVPQTVLQQYEAGAQIPLQTQAGFIFQMSGLADPFTDQIDLVQLKMAAIKGPEMATAGADWSAWKTALDAKTLVDVPGFKMEGSMQIDAYWRICSGAPEPLPELRKYRWTQVQCGGGWSNYTPKNLFEKFIESLSSQKSYAVGITGGASVDGMSSVDGVPVDDGGTIGPSSSVSGSSSSSSSTGSGPSTNPFSMDSSGIYKISATMRKEGNDEDTTNSIYIRLEPVAELSVSSPPTITRNCQSGSSTSVEYIVEQDEDLDSAFLSALVSSGSFTSSTNLTGIGSPAVSAYSSGAWYQKAKVTFSIPHSHQEGTGYYLRGRITNEYGHQNGSDVQSNLSIQLPWNSYQYYVEASGAGYGGGYGMPDGGGGGGGYTYYLAKGTTGVKLHSKATVSNCCKNTSNQYVSTSAPNDSWKPTMESSHSLSQMFTTSISDPWNRTYNCANNGASVECTRLETVDLKSDAPDGARVKFDDTIQTLQSGSACNLYGYPGSFKIEIASAPKIEFASSHSVWIADDDSSGSISIGSDTADTKVGVRLVGNASALSGSVDVRVKDQTNATVTTLSVTSSFGSSNLVNIPYTMPAVNSNFTQTLRFEYVNPADNSRLNLGSNHQARFRRIPHKNCKKIVSSSYKQNDFRQISSSSQSSGNNVADLIQVSKSTDDNNPDFSVPKSDFLVIGKIPNSGSAYLKYTKTVDGNYTPLSQYNFSFTHSPYTEAEMKSNGYPGLGIASPVGYSDVNTRVAAGNIFNFYGFMYSYSQQLLDAVYYCDHVP